MSSTIFVVLLTLSCTYAIVQQDGNRKIRAIAPQPPKLQQNVEQKNATANKQIPTLEIAKIHQNKVNLNIEKSPNKTVTIKAANTTEPTKIEDDIPKLKTTEMESGAVMRGVLVFVALSVLFICYLAVKTYCFGKKRVVLFKKYGIRVGRNDVEMTPLPLDEDEDDETVFDLGNVKR